MQSLTPFHRVERTIKVLNAITMGLVENPIHDPEPPELPELPPGEWL